jgi:hypothetical protein
MSIRASWNAGIGNTGIEKNTGIECHGALYITRTGKMDLTPSDHYYLSLI